MGASKCLEGVDIFYNRLRESPIADSLGTGTSILNRSLVRRFNAQSAFLRSACHLEGIENAASYFFSTLSNG